jgi:hypothetical protein
MYKAQKHIVMIGGKEVDLRGLNQKQLKAIHKLVPNVVTHEVSTPKPSKPDAQPDVSGGA